MAYANLIKQPCNNVAEIFKHFRDFVCRRNGSYDYSTSGIGWSLVDSSYATDEHNPASGDWFVVYSAGEGGQDDMYYRFTYAGESGSFWMSGFLSWDSSSHSGTKQYGGFSPYHPIFTVTAGAVASILIYGDLDHVCVIPNYTGGRADGFSFGRCIDGPYNQEIVSTVSPVSAGTDVQITLSAVPSCGFEQFRYIYIRDATNIEIIRIKNISGNIVTADLTNSYASGAKLQADLTYICNNTTNFCIYSDGTSHCVLITRKGTFSRDVNVIGFLTQNYHTFDYLQGTKMMGVVPALMGSYVETEYAGFAGRVPNVYRPAVPVSSGSFVHDKVYEMGGRLYRCRVLENIAEYFLFLEV